MVRTSALSGPRTQAPALAPSVPVAFHALSSVFLARARRAWRPYLVVSTAMPAGIVLLLGLVGRLSPGAAQTAVEGAMDLVIGITAVTLLAQQVSEAVHNGSFDLLRTLPVPPVLILLSLFVSATIFAIPGLAVVAMLGHLLYGGRLDPDPALVLVLLMTGLSLGGIGAFVGLVARSEAVAGLVGNLVMMTVLFLGIVPVSQMPATVIAVRDALPVGPAVGALARALHGGLPAPWQLAVLALWAAAGALAGRHQALCERARGH